MFHMQGCCDLQYPCQLSRHSRNHIPPCRFLSSNIRRCQMSESAMSRSPVCCVAISSLLCRDLKSTMSRSQVCYVAISRLAMPRFQVSRYQILLCRDPKNNIPRYQTHWYRELTCCHIRMHCFIIPNPRCRDFRIHFSVYQIHDVPISDISLSYSKYNYVAV